MVESRSINNGENEINRFVSYRFIHLNIEIKDCFDTFREIRSKKYDVHHFYIKQSNSLLWRVDNLDNVKSDVCNIDKMYFFYF